MRADYLRKLYKENALPEEYLTVENLKLLYDDEIKKIEIPDNWDFSLEQFDEYLKECDFDQALADFCIEKLNILEPNQAADLQHYHGAMKQVEKVDIQFKILKVTKKVACALTIIVCSLFSTQMIGKALGVDLLNMFIDNVNQYMTLKQGGSEFDFVEVSPGRYSFEYLPKGYQEIDRYFRDTDYGVLYVYQYGDSSSEKNVTLQVKEFTVKAYSATIETNDDTTEYRQNGQTYYAITNNEYIEIVWVKESVMYILKGLNEEVSIDFLKEIIKNNERSY